MNDLFLDWAYRHKAQDTSRDADQTEWQALKLGATNIDAGIRDEDMGGLLSDEADFDAVSYSLVREDAASRVTDEIERRSSLLGTLYPFRREGNGLVYEASVSRVYEFCLAISFVESLSTHFGTQFQIAFERLVRDVLISHAGREGVIGYRTGMPGDELEPRPRSIKEIIKDLSDKCNKSEWRWNPDIDHPEDPAARDLGDLGMDVVVWRPIDSRGGNLFLLTQCACGLTDWQDKFDEPNRRRLEEWIRPLGSVPFVKMFAVPFHIANEAYLRDVSKQAEAVVFDRARIVRIADMAVNKSTIAGGAPRPYAELVAEAVSGGQDVPRGKRRPRRKAAGARRSR